MAGSSWPTLIAGAKARASDLEAKFDWIEQDLVPMTGGTKTDATYDLGDSSFRWRDVRWSRQALSPDGSVSSPGFSFAQDVDCGAYRIAANNWALTTAGQKVMEFGSSGYILKPLQPCFLAELAGGTSIDNIFGGSSNVTVRFNTEIFDNGSNYDASTYIFTAPVAGKYHFSTNFTLGGLDTSSHRLIQVVIKTTSKQYILVPYSDSATDIAQNQMGISMSVVASMAASDTCFVYVYMEGSTDVDLIYAQFSGYLVA